MSGMRLTRSASMIHISPLGSGVNDEGSARAEKGCEWFCVGPLTRWIELTCSPVAITIASELSENAAKRIAWITPQHNKADIYVVSITSDSRDAKRDAG